MERYKIMDIVGVGGMGSVYRARDLHFPNAMKVVAVKEMVNNTTDPQVRDSINKNFEREANILVSLSHHSIPKIFDFFIKDERSYLVEEFIQGNDLDEIMRRTPGPFKEEQVISWAIEICDVLDYLHQHKPDPVIFRDIKPSNIMINPQNHVILVDFGIAKNIIAGQKGTMIGTEGFSPPEQYRGEASPKTDIYALGATMHTLLTRRDPRLEPPFSFKDRPVRMINPSVSTELEAIINKTLEYNPEDRYRNVLELKSALISVARRTGTLPFVYFERDGSSPEVRDAEWVFKCNDEIRGTPLFDRGTIYVGSYDKSLYALEAKNGDLKWRFDTKGGVVTRPIVADNLLYFGSEDGCLYCINKDTGQQMWIYKTDGPIRSSPRIAEGQIYFGSDDQKMYAIKLLSHQLIWSAKAGGAVRSSPFLSLMSIYFGSEANEFICANYRGQIEWRFFTKKPVTSSGNVNDGVAYFSSLDGFVYALDAKTGWVIWRYRMAKGSVSSPLVLGERVFVGSADGNIYCLERTRAQEIWHFQTGFQVSSSPVVDDDVLYCGSTDGKFYALDVKTGHLKWSYSTLGPITGSAAIGERLVYFGSHDKNLYAFRI